MRINKVYIILFALFAALVSFEYFAPKEPDWSLSFSKEDKIPFGDYVLYHLLEDAFPNAQIKVNEKSIYNFTDKIDYKNCSFIFNTDEFKIYDLSLDSLLNIAEKGSKVFISAYGFSEKIMDTLNFDIGMKLEMEQGEDSLPVNFVHPKLKTKNGYLIGKQLWAFYFTRFDSTKAVILGTIGTKKNINYIKIPYGKGAFYLHTLPLAFTNYNILRKNNAEYSFKALSYLQNKYIFWDESYKPGKSQKAGAAPDLFAQIRKSPALNYAYNLLWLIAILFFLINAKRKQRAMPVINAPENASLEFAGTLANLYLSNSNHQAILLKRYLYWTDFLREKYFLNIEAFETKNTAEIIALKTGAEIKCINKIIAAFNKAQNSTSVNSEELLRFNKLLEKFYKSRL